MLDVLVVLLCLYAYDSMRTTTNASDFRLTPGPLRLMMSRRAPRAIPGSISVSTRACHARKRGSTPRQRVEIFGFNYTVKEPALLIHSRHRRLGTGMFEPFMSALQKGSSGSYL